jgi:hypothetical protein
MDMKVEQLPRDFIAASHVARVAIQLANIGKSTPGTRTESGVATD